MNMRAEEHCGLKELPGLSKLVLVPRPPSEGGPTKRRPQQRLQHSDSGLSTDVGSSASVSACSSECMSSSGISSSSSSSSSSPTPPRAASAHGRARLPAVFRRRARAHVELPSEVGETENWSLVFEGGRRDSCDRQEGVRQAAREMLRAKRGSVKEAELRERLEELKVQETETEATQMDKLQTRKTSSTAHNGCSAAALRAKMMVSRKVRTTSLPPRPRLPPIDASWCLA